MEHGTLLPVCGRVYHKQLPHFLLNLKEDKDGLRFPGVVQTSTNSKENK